MAKKKPAALAADDNSFVEELEKVAATTQGEASKTELEEKEEKQEVSTTELFKLKEQLEKERKDKEAYQRRYEAAETEKEDYVKRLNTETTERTKAQTNSIESRIEASKAKADRLKQEMKEAIEAGKFDIYSELNADYAQAKIDIREDEKEKSRFKEKIEKEPATKDDGLTPETRKWIKEHPQFMSDSRYRAKATGAHHLAMAEGYEVDTPDYFEYIESIIEPKQNKKTEVVDDEDEAEEEIAASNKANTRTTSLPPSRSGSGLGGNKDTKQIRLSADEVEAAMWSFPNDTAADAQAKYYKQKLALKAAGRL